MISAYDRGLNFVFRHQFATLMSTLVLMLATGFLYVQIPKGFFPQQDTGTVFGEVDTRQDASFVTTAEIAHQVVDIIRQDPNVGGAFMLAGASERTLREALDLYREIGATRHAERLALDIQPTSSQGGQP
jgi:HAE1 family hydrophobic/amphiphilic exporter-1